MAKKKALSLIGIILMAVALVGAILTIVGVCVDWAKYTVTVLGKSSSEASTLKEIADAHAKMKDLGRDGYKMFGAMNAFAYITMILAIVSAAAVVLGKFLNIKLLQPISGIAGLLTVVSTILLIIFVCVFCSKNGSVSVGDLGNGKLGWAAGPVLAVIGGIFSGASAVVSYKK